MQQYLSQENGIKQKRLSRRDSQEKVLSYYLFAGISATTQCKVVSNMDTDVGSGRAIFRSCLETNTAFKIAFCIADATTVSESAVRTRT